MEAFLENALSYLISYKYVALFSVTFLAAFALPLPSTTSLMTAAGFASQGYLNIGLVILWATLGNVLADSMIYWITRLVSPFFIEKLGLRIEASPILHFMTERLRDRPEWIIFWSRFQVIPTIAVNFLSGIAKSDYRRFFWFGLAGETAQVLLFAALGYFFGNSVTGLVSVFGRFAIIPVLVLLVVFMLFRRTLSAYLKKRSRLSAES